MNHGAKQFAVAYLRLRDKAKLLAGQQFLLSGNHRHILWMGLQRLVRLRMPAHIVHANRLYRRKGCFLLLYLADNALPAVVYNPVREIMQT